MLDGHLALVTGAGQGIGEGIARVLAERGARVVVTDLDGERAEQVASSIGSNARAYGLDVRNRGEIEAVVDEIETGFGPISVLVNNAGVNRVGASETLSEELWLEVVEINLNALFRCTQIVARRMLSRGAGSVINLASANSEVGMPGRAAYCATKTGVVGLTRALAVEWAARGVRVNAVAPGYVRTPMVENAIRDGLLDEELVLDRIPARHLGSIEDIGRAVAFLASDDAAYVTGRTLAIDGGFLAYGAPAPTSAIPDREYRP